MGKFIDYSYSYLEDRWLSENRNVFGHKTNEYQKGFGFGFYGSSFYCRPEGNGVGYGYYSGNENNIYPYQLIQYWPI